MYLGQLPAAAEHLQRATLLDPKRADYPAQLARALTAMRLPREALQAADRAFALSPTDTQTLNPLGIVYTQPNAHEPALALSPPAVALMPGRASHRFTPAPLLTFARALHTTDPHTRHTRRLNPTPAKHQASPSEKETL